MSSRLPGLHPLIWFLFLGLLSIGLALVPLHGLDARMQVAVEASRSVLALGILLAWVGWALGSLLLPAEWKHYEPLLLVPLGAIVVVPLAHFLNIFVDMGTATAILLLAATPLALWRGLRGVPMAPWHIGLLIPAVGGIALLAIAIAPHLVQGSLGPLALNNDEETYFYLSQYMLSYPAGGGMSGPPAPIFVLSYTREEGWAFHYLLAVASAIGGIETFNAYLPTAYLLLAASVPAWYIFFREAFGFSTRSAGIAAGLYALHGLPLWFALYGYGKHVAWIALMPLALGALVRGLRSSDGRAILLAGLAIGSFISSDARVAMTLMAVSVVGVGVYWLVADRRPALPLRLLATLVVTAAVAAPTLWHFTHTYLLSGGGLALLRSGQGQFDAIGPGLSGFPPIRVALGLEPNELAMVPGSIDGLSRLDPIGLAMSNLSSYLTYPLLAVVGIGVLVLARRSPMALALAVPLLAYVAATRWLISFPYGYFKLLSIASPLLLGFIVAGASWLYRPCVAGRVPVRLARVGQPLSLLICLLLTVFLVRNSLETAMFGARGWYLSISPSLVRDLMAVGGSTEPGSRVYVSNIGNYTPPGDPTPHKLKHRLAIQDREDLSLIWADRVQALVASSLVGRQLYGTFKTEVLRWSVAPPEEGECDYYLLRSDEDPRIRGLDGADVVAAARGVTLYRSPSTLRASSEHILAARGTMRIEPREPLVLAASGGEFHFAPVDLAGANPVAARLRLSLVALTETTLEVRAGDHRRRLTLDPGLTWYETPTIRMPAQLRVEVAGPEPVRIVAIRILPPGEEALERSPDAVLSSEVVARNGGVDVELWFSNPMRDARDARAHLVTQIERRIDLEVPARGQRWLFRFPLQGGVQQLRQGVEQVPMEEQLPWLEKGGGSLLLRFRLGHGPPRDVQLAKVGMAGGQILRLERNVDPVPLKLWGHDDRPQEKLPPEASTLEGRLVRRAGGPLYLVVNGQRRWVPDDALVRDRGEPMTLFPEQLWMIPPGLPLGNPASPRGVLGPG